ncbi:hypothetical protein WJX73_001027 [Symbiochloris irregularis]|uniref:Major facilitator superfamily (MFS) profile domain-containing protein n=1 Tax=Symbiochloris irregularis TaxID=706552 RepID=A0AAW1P1C3_9CHLO
MAGVISAASARTRTTVLLNLASIVEKADEQVLPAVYFFIMRSLKCTPSQLGTLTLCRALVQALSSPISGVLGDKYDRTHIIAVGCFLWGIMTSAIGLSTSVYQAMLWCAFNGVGLALVIPCIQSLIADYNPPEQRGSAFGLMFFISAMGGMIGGFFGTNVGHFQPLGIEGWRLAFHLMALVSLVTAALVFLHAADPRRKGLISPLLLSELGMAHAHKDSMDEKEMLRHATGSHGSLKSMLNARPASGGKGTSVSSHFRQMYEDVMTVMRIRTFQLIILQGIVGTTPWCAMVFFTLWLQLLGFSDLVSSTIMATFSCGCALGAFMWGLIGDQMSRRFPNAGRIITCQLSVVTGLPLSALVLKGLPTTTVGGGPMDELLLTYACSMLLMGFVISGCGANNSAMFADIVPEELRSTVYAFDRSFEGGVAASAAPLVGLIAENAFGYAGSVGEAPGATGEAQNRSNADALSSSLLVCLLVPWSLCFLFYFSLYSFYPRDRRKTKELSAALAPHRARSDGRPGVFGSGGFRRIAND